MAEREAGVTAPVVAVNREDYRPPAFLVDSIALSFHLHETETRVCARSQFRRSGSSDAPLVLDGADQTLLSVKLDGETLESDRYTLSDSAIEIASVPDQFELVIETLIHPQDNTRLSGLYKSGGNFCTQCEAEGFRHITYFPDRPDVMARYVVRIEADKAKYPVLLSNGNLVESGKAEQGRHYTVWDDPFPKPSYLFALVAGELATLEDQYTTRSGRVVALKIHVRQEDLDKCGHAMQALKKSFAWDEEVYGLEYDLDIYNIVAVSDFNMGAMENKSLNVFNTKYVLASAETATDDDFDHVEGVIAHEYFHNWTGNRVTCRDWFQLSLKEGLTVFRDQEFSSDMGSRAVKRISDVQVLRAHQFPEDAGPMAHPIRPDSYVEINNFYTATVYNKGAEVIRMMRTFLGRDAYSKGIELYFERHDGQAVTCEDFVSAMEDASGVDLMQFRRWYAQAGTPKIKVSGEFDAERQQYRLEVTQSVPATPGQPDKAPMHLPLIVGLIDESGQELTPDLPDGSEGCDDGILLHVRAEQQSFVFENVETKPVPSLLRNFSAPVAMEDGLSHDERLLLAAHDRDPFARSEAIQNLATELIFSSPDDKDERSSSSGVKAFIGAIKALLDDPQADDAFKALAISLPPELILGQYRTPMDVDGIHTARSSLRRAIGEGLRVQWQAIYEGYSDTDDFKFDQLAKAKRKLRNVALSYLAAADPLKGAERALKQFHDASNMTDSMAALSVLSFCEGEAFDQALDAFLGRWKHEELIIDKWFSVQAMSSRRDTSVRVGELSRHSLFTLSNPNRARSLVGAFAVGNPLRFHNINGEGYTFVADMIIALDALNPQVAARLSGPLGQWQRVDEVRQGLMKEALARISSQPGLSKDVLEIVTKALEA